MVSMRSRRRVASKAEVGEPAELHWQEPTLVERSEPASSWGAPVSEALPASWGAVSAVVSGVAWVSGVASGVLGSEVSGVAGSLVSGAVGSEASGVAGSEEVVSPEASWVQEFCLQE